jgi:hypothetical protein
MSVSLERLARNQTLFREVNERLLELNDGQDRSTVFVCECSNVDCAATMAIGKADYESVRAHPTFFAIVPGHEILEIEKVIDQKSGFTIVQKLTETDFVVETDPRRNGDGSNWNGDGSNSDGDGSNYTV